MAAMIIETLSPKGGVSVSGIDMARLSPEESAQLSAAFEEHGLLVIRGQNLTKQQLLAATEPFGGPYLNPPAENCDPDVPGVSEIRTRGPNGEIIHRDDDELLGETGWHTDHAYLATLNRGKLLYAVDVPEERGGTGFIDGFATYDALPDATKRRVEGLHVIQSWNHAQAVIQKNKAYRDKGETVLADNRFADMAYPLVITHPHSGKKALNCPPLWASGIVELPGEEGRALVAELIGHLTAEKFVHWHRYRPGDIAAWDNWRYLHSAEGTPGRCVRRIWSVVIRGGKVTGSEIGRREAEAVGG
jgi:taurine dioxygenase